MQPDGFLLKLADKAFHKAGIRVRYESLPTKQILNSMYSGLPVCSIGWFKTPEREAYARFSRSIYKNHPLELVYLKKNETLLWGMESLDRLTRDKSLTLGLPRGYSLGKVVDGIIERNKPSVYVANGGYADLFRLLAAEQITYFLAAAEYIDFHIRRNRLNPTLFAHRNLVDVPERNTRHLMYSQGVPEEVIRRIDKALEPILEDMGMTD